MSALDETGPSGNAWHPVTSAGPAPLLRPAASLGRRGALYNRWTLALVLLWTIEVFAVQELTLVPMHYQTGWSEAKHWAARFTLDLLACAGMTLVMPRIALVALFFLSPLFFGTVLVYHGYFHQALSSLVVLNQTGEGASVFNAGLSLLSPYYLLLLVTLGAKSWLARAGIPLGVTRSVRPAIALWGAYCALILALNPLLKNMRTIGTWESVGGIGSVYGYLPTWAAELAFTSDSALVSRAIDRAEQDAKQDRGAPLRTEGSFPVRDRIVFLQVESLDEAAIEFRIGGREVTPFLNQLARRSFRYVVQAPKGTGSCDADFEALMGRLGSADIPTYKIVGYPYAKSFVEHLERLGYETAAVHGVTGGFFNRREPYQAMGFDRLTFREEFARDKLAPVESWTVEDHHLLAYAARQLNARPGRQFQLVITASSHIPYPVEQSRKVFFPGGTRNEETYFDSIHYVDDSIRRFYEALPRGTTLVLYGDHTSQIANPAVSYAQRMRAGVGCVPFFIVDVGEDLSSLQRTSDAVARSCQLRRLDLLRFVHTRVEENVARLARQNGR